MTLCGGASTNLEREAKVLVCSLDQRYLESLEGDSEIYSRHYRYVKCMNLAGLNDLSMALQEGYDIIHLYCSLSTGGVLRDQSNGSLIGTDLLTKCCENRVKVLWIASENDPGNYIGGFKAQSKSLNLIMTIDRNRARFSDFLEKLLIKVSSGESLPLAWAKLVPQAPGPWQDELPRCIFFAGAPNADLSSNYGKLKST